MKEGPLCSRCGEEPRARNHSWGNKCLAFNARRSRLKNPEVYKEHKRRFYDKHPAYKAPARRAVAELIRRHRPEYLELLHAERLKTKRREVAS